MAKEIEFYNLDKEYPVSYEIWKDVSAFFLYFGYFRFFAWKWKFKDETYVRVKQAFIDADEKIKSGISFHDYEIAKDFLLNNHGSFRHFFERAEKITTLNFKQKIDWTIGKVYKNLKPRISPQNRLNLESDFYKDCRLILYNKLIIHYYAVNRLNIEPLRLSFDPLLIDENYKDKIKSDLSIINDGKSKNQVSFLLNSEQNLTFSKKLESLFKDKELFEKIDFFKLKEYDIIYESESERLKFNSKRTVADLLILVSYLYNLNLIKLNYAIDYQDVILEIISEVLNKTVDKGRISRIFNSVNDYKGSYTLSANDEESLFKIKEFMSQYI